VFISTDLEEGYDALGGFFDLEGFRGWNPVSPSFPGTWLFAMVAQIPGLP
jgi:hypothetical protein